VRVVAKTARSISCSLHLCWDGESMRNLVAANKAGVGGALTHYRH